MLFDYSKMANQENCQDLILLSVNLIACNLQLYFLVYCSQDSITITPGLGSIFGYRSRRSQDYQPKVVNLSVRLKNAQKFDLMELACCDILLCTSVYQVTLTCPDDVNEMDPHLLPASNHLKNGLLLNAL